MMKTKFFLLACMLFAMSAANAQESYIVKTRGAKKSLAKAGVENVATDKEEEAPDFVSQNFKFYSLCDWTEGMKFMVIPDKYDLVVNTFVDASTDKEVASMSLKHKIMIYKGHDTDAAGHARVLFNCPELNKNYYYQIPSGSFDNYCFGKLGVPTLAYLGDVDIARTKLMGQTLYTKATLFRVDTQTDGDGYEEITVPQNTVCKVTAVGVGTRNFPVKIIVEGPDGKEFYQNVAMSRTNSGMRDDEFIMDNTKFTFYGSFEMVDATLSAKSEYASFIGKRVYTKYATSMYKSSGERVNISRLSSFIIKSVRGTNSNYVDLTLQGATSGNLYTKQVTFKNENVAGDIDGYKEDYYYYLFGTGNAASLKKYPAAHRKLIQAGKIGIGFSKAEVRLAKGDPDKKAASSNGRVDWIWDDGTIAKFNRAGKVFKISRL